MKPRFVVFAGLFVVGMVAGCGDNKTAQTGNTGSLQIQDLAPDAKIPTIDPQSDSKTAAAMQFLDGLPTGKKVNAEILDLKQNGILTAIVIRDFSEPKGLTK